MSQAKTISDDQLQLLLQHVAAKSSHPLRDYVIVLLSFKAGLRAAEVAGLSWTDVTDALGNIGPEIVVPAAIAKKKHGRSIPMHPAVLAALRALRTYLPAAHTAPDQPIIRGAFIPRMTGNHMQKYVGRLYRAAGFQGASSHSGRRTFITKLARDAANVGCSLKDVQALAGHRYIDTTEAYIERSARVGELVGRA